MKIRTAIFGVYAAASAVGLAVLMRFMLAEVRPRYVDSLQRTLQETARLLAAVLQARAGGGGARADGLKWTDEYEALSRADPGVRLRVLDTTGRVRFDSAGARAEPVGDDRSGIARRMAMRALDQEAVPDDGELSATEPLTVDGRRVGAIVVSRPLRSVNAFIWSERKKLARDAALVAAVMLVAGWWLSAKLTQSLERLTRYALAVRDGRVASVPASRATEIAALGRAFEEMRATIEGKAYVERYTQALAHELKAPLAAIRGAAELLAEEMPEVERLRFLGNLRTEAARIQRIVDRMLELAALEARHGRLEPAAFAMNELLAEVVAAAAPIADARQIALRLAGAPRIAASGERSLVAEAVTNLVHNALEFTPRGGEVTVSLAVRAPQLCITIEDTGVGVPDYALPRLFERFYSLPRPETGRKSTGLGLSITREIARLHGGEATMENRAEGGARAVFTLAYGEDRAG